MLGFKKKKKKKDFPFLCKCISMLWGLFVFPPTLKGATDDAQIGSRTAGCRPPIRSMVAETLPLGDDARIYGHQVCLGADISRVLLIDGGDVAPAERIIKKTDANLWQYWV